MKELTPTQVQQLQKITEQLMKAREAKGLSLEEVAAKTYIPLRLLQALDEGNYERLPEPVFVQGFIRRYGEVSGLNGLELSKTFTVESSNPLNFESTILTPVPIAPAKPVSPLPAIPLTEETSSPSEEEFTSLDKEALLEFSDTEGPIAGAIGLTGPSLDSEMDVLRVADLSLAVPSPASGPTEPLKVDRSALEESRPTESEVTQPELALSELPESGVPQSLPSIPAPLPPVQPVSALGQEESLSSAIAPDESSLEPIVIPDPSPVTQPLEEPLPVADRVAAEPPPVVPRASVPVFEPEPAPRSWTPWAFAGGAIALLAATSFALFNQANQARQPLPEAASPQPSPSGVLPSPSSAIAPTPTTSLSPTPSLGAEASPSASPTAALTKPIQVTVTLTEEAWIEVIADGEVKFEGERPKGFQQTWSGQKTVEVSSGNAGGVSISYNNSPAQPLGEAGQIATKRFPLEPTPTPVPSP